MNKKLKPETVALLLQIKRWLLRLRHPEHFNMRDFATKTDCGTALCIGGKAMLLRGYKVRQFMSEQVNEDGFTFFSSSGRRVDVWPTAKRELKLNEDQANRLFLWSNWPLEFENTPKDGAKRIDRFIATNGAE